VNPYLPRCELIAQHNLAHDWLDQQLNAFSLVGLLWPSVLGSYVWSRTHALTRSTILGSKCAPGLHLRRPGYRSLPSGTLICWVNFLRYAGVHGNLVPDAHLAALAVEHGLILCSTDGDFERFHGLCWLSPIAP
jgi:uncharacterized protein